MPHNFPAWPIRSPEFIDDPYQFYHRRRGISPIGKTQPGPWCLTGYDVIAETLLHPDIGAFAVRSDAIDKNSKLYQLGSRWVVFCDPPIHTRIRRMVGQSFYRLVKEDAEKIIAKVLEKLLAELENKEEIEFISEFAYPIPLHVILKLVGVPPEDWTRVAEWVKPLAVLIDAFVKSSYTFAEIEAAAGALMDYLIDLVEKRRSHPCRDVISSLTQTSDNEPTISTEDLISNLSFFLLAGHETTVNLLGNGLFALLKERESWESLVRIPEKIPIAVEELLRYDSPVQLTIKQALKTIEIGGCRIDAGDELRLFIGSANRDPSHFEHPDRLILDRSPNPHLAFGKGIHSCMGAALARMEGKMAFRMLCEKFPNMKLSESNPPRRVGLALRGFQRIPLILNH